MINSAFKDKDYIKRRYGTAQRVFGFLQGFGVFAVLLFLLVFTCRFYWLHNFDKAIKNGQVLDVEIVEININQGFNDIESCLYFFALLAEMKVVPVSDVGEGQSQGRIFIHSALVKRMEFSIGDSLSAYTSPSKPSTLFPVEYCKSVSEMFRHDLVFSIILTSFLIFSAYVFRWKRNSITKDIYSNDYDKVVGVCLSKSAMDRTVRFKYEVSGKTRKKEDIVTSDEFEQISVGDQLSLLVPRGNPKRPFIRPMNPVVIDEGTALERAI